MTPIIEDAVLGSDLNCQFHDLLNVNQLVPAPPGLVGDNDPRLSDPRIPIPGSVVDASVAIGAGIVQSKLSLNGTIPPAWLGTTSTTAAPGDQAEYLSHKNQPLGYAGLDSGGKVPAAQLPGTVGTGTVTSVALTMPSQFSVTGSPVTASGTISSVWATALDLSWFGNKEGAAGPPKFYTTPFPVALIPALDASIVTSGVFDPARLPVAIGLGVSHAAGAVPDPGSGIAGDGPMMGTEKPTDYLARDMTYKPVPVFGPSYQPVVPNPDLSIGLGPPYPVTVSSTLAGASLFYSVDNSTSGFVPIVNGAAVLINPGQIVYAYASRTGYTNSAVVNMPAPYAPPGELVVTGDPLNPNEIVIGDDTLNVTVGP
jgi:hypothetical protein